MVAVALSTGLVAEDDSCDDRDEQDRENFDDAKVYLHRGRGWHTVVVVSKRLEYGRNRLLPGDCQALPSSHPKPNQYRMGPTAPW
jgi:hypothetical protein